MLGNWVLFIALPFHVYTLTGSTLARGAMFIAESLPAIVIGSFAGIFVDRWNRQWTMVGADIGRGVALLPLLLVQNRQSVWIVYVVAFIVSVFGQFFGPAQRALVPHLVTGDDLLPANALSH
jgi:Na+/melibiose symporter-like transporter